MRAPAVPCGVVDMHTHPPVCRQTSAIPHARQTIPHPRACACHAHAHARQTLPYLVPTRMRAKPAMVPAVDDIFGDVGSEYVCQPSATQLQRAAKDAADAKLVRGMAASRHGSAAPMDDQTGDGAEAVEQTAPPLKWEDEDEPAAVAAETGPTRSGSGASSSTQAATSLLARAMAESVSSVAASGGEKKGGREPAGALDADGDVADEELLQASAAKKAGAQPPTSVSRDLKMSATAMGDSYEEVRATERSRVFERASERAAHHWTRSPAPLTRIACVLALVLQCFPDTFQGYSNALQLGADSDEEEHVVRSKSKEDADGPSEEPTRGKGAKGKRGGVDVDALKREAKMDRELVAIEKLMEERRQKRQRRDDAEE